VNIDVFLLAPINVGKPARSGQPKIVTEAVRHNCLASFRAFKRAMKG
jgi:bifunctional N-acetylglucosamine-1-phosphate-uridyltransferase/glucosamine-1-phosphate-acetyltransferase GlmU-like protein